MYYVKFRWVRSFFLPFHSLIHSSLHINQSQLVLGKSKNTYMNTVLCCLSNLRHASSYVVMNPSRSWVAKWQRTSSFVPGAYAIKIDAKIPEETMELLVENNVRLHAVLATADNE